MGESSLPSSLYVQFEDGTTLAPQGPPVVIPAISSPKDLDAVLKKLLPNTVDDDVTFSYYVRGKEITTSVGEACQSSDQDDASFEKAIAITFRRHLPVPTCCINRCQATCYGHDNVILCSAFSPDGKYLVSGSGDKSVRFWDTNTFTPLSKSAIVHSGWVLCLAWSPDGNFLASGDLNGMIAVWKAPCFESPIKIWKAHKSWITEIAWDPCAKDPNQNRLLSGSKDETAKIWSLYGICGATLSHTAAVTSVRWSIFTRKIYTASKDRSISLWNDTGSLQGRFACNHAHWINCIALSNDHLTNEGGTIVSKSTIGKELLVSGSEDHTLLLWDTSKPNASIARLVGHQGPINHVSFSPDGQLIASASFDHTVRLWKASDGSLVTVFRGHRGRVYRLAWSPDSRLVASCSQDASLRIWDANKKKPLQTLPGHADEIFTISWSADGAIVASGGRDKMLKIWCT